MRFHGAYQHNVDAKGRLSLPARFRKDLPEDVIVVPVTSEGFGKALYVFDEEGFQKWVDGFFEMEEQGFDPRSQRHIALFRYLNASAETLTIDAAGRIKLSAAQCAKVGIGKEVTVVGQGNRLEIWDSASWNDFMDSVDPFEAFLKS